MCVYVCAYVLGTHEPRALSGKLNCAGKAVWIRQIELNGKKWARAKDPGPSTTV